MTTAARLSGALAIFASLVCVEPARAQSPITSSKVRLYASKSCGERFVFECAKLSRSKGAAVSGIFTTPAVKIAATAGSYVTIYWSGDLSCAMNFDKAPAGQPAADNSKIGYSVSLQARQGPITAFDPTEEGTTHFFRQYPNLNPSVIISDPYVDTIPISITKTFRKQNSATYNYYVAMLMELRNGTGSCTVSGGKAIATVFDVP